MAQYQKFSDTPGAPDVATRLDRFLAAILAQWRTIAAIVVLLAVAGGGLAWRHAHQESFEMQASQAYFEADQLKDAARTAALVKVATAWADSTAGLMARFALAQQALAVPDFPGARVHLEAILQRPNLSPDIQASALFMKAATFEQDSAWAEAAKLYEQILALIDPRVNYARALHNAVRSWRRAGKIDDAKKLLAAPYPHIQHSEFTAAREDEQLWLTIVAH